MTQHTSDAVVFGRIESLVHEEQRLYRDSGMSDADRQRLETIRVELDRCWDLLRQRRARREFGRDADGATLRSASTVENYEQ